MIRNFSLQGGVPLKAPASKRDLNARLFAIIAHEYRFITRALSFGRDSSWKRQLVGLLPNLEQPRCLDIACGQGELTRLLASRYPQGLVVGLDLTGEMLALARSRTTEPNVRFLQQDLSALGLPSMSVDVVTGGYALRNAPELREALREIYRVLRPQGCVSFLDFSKSPNPWAQRVALALLEVWGGFWGLLLHANTAMYRYIAATLRLYPDRQQLHALFAAEGFSILQSRLFFCGVIELVVLQKESAGSHVGNALGLDADKSRPLAGSANRR